MRFDRPTMMGSNEGLLLIDIGNTRIKWRHLASTWSADDHYGNAGLTDVAGLKLAWRNLDIARVQVANVAGTERLSAVLGAVVKSRHDETAVTVLTASATQCGVVNCYPEPALLGADRWAALIGAHALRAARSSAATTMIVSLGTATTIDVLMPRGLFAGGIILPGIMTMRRALATHTARLAETGGRYVPVADNTGDAITSGILHAHAGAIERVWRHVLQQDDRLECVLSGGDAAMIEPLLPFPSRIEDQLVLRGLYEIAHEKNSISPESEVLLPNAEGALLQ